MNRPCENGKRELIGDTASPAGILLNFIKMAPFSLSHDYEERDVILSIHSDWIDPILPHLLFGTNKGRIIVPSPSSARSFCIGPDASLALWYGKRLDLPVERGPCQCSGLAI